MNIDDRYIESYYKGCGTHIHESMKKRGILIHAFQEMQKEYNYLPEDKLRELSRKLNLSLADIYSTVTFYKHFYLKPRGKNVVCVCMGTACHVRGASKVLERLKNEFGVNEGETTPDMSLTLETVGCVGCCGLAPVVTLNEEVVGEIGSKKLDELIKTIKTEAIK